MSAFDEPSAERMLRGPSARFSTCLEVHEGQQSPPLSPPPSPPDASPPESPVSSAQALAASGRLSLTADLAQSLDLDLAATCGEEEPEVLENGCAGGSRRASFEGAEDAGPRASFNNVWRKGGGRASWSTGIIFSVS